MQSMQVLYIHDDDLPYEEDLIRNANLLKPWLRYFEHKRNSPDEERFYLYERALLEFVTSYKIWKAYLDDRRDSVFQRQQLFTDQANFANNCYERALIFLHRMPRIWLDYAEFLLKQGKLRLTRKTFNRALHSLPIIQHERIWNKYIEFVQVSFLPAAIGIKIWKRYIQYNPKKRPEFLDYLLTHEELNEASLLIVSLLKEESETSTNKDELLKELCRIICQNPSKITSISVEDVLRFFLKKYPEKSGMIWCSLGNYQILEGNLVGARFVLEEGLNSVRSIKDFALIFDVYYQLEESLMTSYFSLVDAGQSVDSTEMELLSMRIQRLLDDRERLVNDTFLRKNPNDISYWQQRISLFSQLEDKSLNNQTLVDIFETAISKINPKRTIGNYATLWINYAHHQYKQPNGIEEARKIFERALQIDFKTDDELAQVWIAYCKQEIEFEKSFKTAIELLQKATKPILKSSDSDERFTLCQLKLHKNASLWSYFVDVLEMHGNIELVCQAYDKMIDLKLCTCQTILNYAFFLEQHNRIEESFTVYERGIELFGYPVAYELWNIFLPRFVHHYGARKLERIRDLFEQALVNCPESFISNLYLYFGMIEEQFGLTRNAMKIYDRASKAVSSREKYDVFIFYIGRAADLYGITATREVFELAIAALPDSQVRDICLMYATMEEKLGELERARYVYAHGAQFANPAIEPSYWQRWNKFELEYGNQGSFKEMLRLKRAIEMKYSSMVVIQKPSLVEGPEFTTAKSH